MGETTYYKKTEKKILNRAKDYYGNNKEENYLKNKKI